MRTAPIALLCLVLCLTACVTEQTSVSDEKPAAAPESIAVVPPPDENEPPAGGTLVLPGSKSPRPAVTTHVPVPVRVLTKPPVSVAAAPQSEVPTIASVAAAASAPSSSVAASSRKPVAAPDWLKACQRVQRQGQVIMCDADRMLAPPSEKIHVYVRDAKLVYRGTSGFSTVLRESLPRLYRIFVLE